MQTDERAQVMTEDFNKWWDSEPLIADNIYPQDTPVYWAWEGWQAAVKTEREACAKIAENGLIGHTIAQAIRARGQG